MQAQHMAHAMNNQAAREALVWFNAPDTLLNWTFVAIELLILVGFVLAVIHAMRYKQAHQSNGAILSLIGFTMYGVFIDILSYYTVDNFWHGEFTVMFVYNRLPLYIILFYPAFMYPCMMLIRRLALPPLKEAVCTGFLSGIFYMIFDNIGAQLQWWTWDTTDPTTWPYVSNVPLTSYMWFFLFTGAFTWINRYISWEWPNKTLSIKLCLAHIIQPVVTVVLGSLMFIPYNLFAKSALPYTLLPWDASLVLAAIVYAILFSAAGWVLLMNWHKPRLPRDPLLMAFPFMYLVMHACLLVTYAPNYFVAATPQEQALLANPFAVLMAIGLASAMLIGLNRQSHCTKKLAQEL